jgi:hypothetical protein
MALRNAQMKCNLRHPLSSLIRDATPCAQLVFLVDLIVCVLAAGPAFGQIRGDTEALAEVARRHRANKERITTWQGRVRVSSTSAWPDRAERSEISETASVEFVWDVTSERKRWNWKWESASSRDRDQPPQHHDMGVESGVVKDGAYYWLRTPDRSKPCTIIIYPASEAAPVTSSPFTSVLDPEFWLGHLGRKTDKYFQHLYDGRKSAGIASWLVTRNGEMVVTELKDDTMGVRRSEVSLAEGGNLTSFVSRNRAVEEEWIWSYEQVAGVWVPKEISVRHEQKSPRATTTRKMTWLKNVVNKPVTDEAFSLAAMGAQELDVVSDQRSGVQFVLSATDIAKEAEPAAASKSRSWLFTLIVVMVLLVLVLAAFLFIRAKKRPTGEAA